MDYKNVYDYSEAISQNLGLSVKWVHADKEWLELVEDIDKGVTCWSLPFVSNGSTTPNISRVFNLTFVFYQQDKQDGSFDQNNSSSIQESIRTLSITDKAAQRFLRLFNSNTINNELERASDTLIINSYSTEPAIRDTAQLLTGTLLTMSVQFPDNFDYCCVDDIV